MPPTATKGRARSAASVEASREGATLPALRVRYYRRMKPQRVYAFEVGWKKGERPTRGGKPVTLRLLVAGAQVAPSEQTLHPARPDALATFHVTPLAKGWLGEVKLEVLSEGRKVQELPLASKATTQRWTWMFLLLAVLVPWLILTYVKYTPLDGPFVHENGWMEIVNTDVAKSLESLIENNVPALPNALDDTPIPEWLREGRRVACEAYAGLVAFSRREPLAFYVGAGFLGLALVSAWLHRTTRKTVWGKSISLGEE